MEDGATDALPDRSLKRFRIDPKALGEIVAILSKENRRAILKLDEQKVDDLATVTPSMLTHASHIDISSYWSDPDRPTWGRRHYVYVMSGPGGLQYFGDSTSLEVTTVLADLDRYFGKATTPVIPRQAAAESVVGRDGLMSPAVLAAIGVTIAIVFFILGRLSV